MIPEFPNFKKLEFSDRLDVEKITSKFLPYSDFNFTSMWCWDAKGNMKISLLHGNLAVRFSDYLSEEACYSFIGVNKVEETAEALLSLSKEEGLPLTLKFIPQEVADKLGGNRFILEEDRDQFDYVIDNEQMTKYKGPSLHNHANFKKRFTEIHSSYLNTKMFDLYSDQSRQYVTAIHKLWAANKIKENKEGSSGLEESALMRIFDMKSLNDHFSVLALFHEEKIIALTIDELLPGDYALRHFMKADTSYKGIYSYLVSESSRVLLEAGKKYTNVEQDLGLKNLRQAKKSYSPDHFLKKYRVSLARKD